MSETEKTVLSSIGTAVASADAEDQRVFAALAAAYAAGKAAGESKAGA